MVEYLISRNAEINSIDSYGWTPCMYACRNSIEMVEFFVKKRANLTILDKFKKSAVDYAVWDKKIYEFILNAILNENFIFAD